MRQQAAVGIRNWITIQAVATQQQPFSICFTFQMNATDKQMKRFNMKAQLNISPLLAASFIVAIIDSTYGQATLASQHLGSADPTTEGFSLSTFGNPQVGPVTNAMKAWSVRVSNSDGAGYYQYLTPQEQTELGGADWTLSLTTQIIFANLGEVVAVFYTGSQLFGLGFGTNSRGDPVVQSESVGQPTYTVSGVGSSYNNYQLIYDAGTGTASLWVNGIQRVGNIAGISESPGVAEVGWGASEQAGGSQANWNLVSLEIVPEPSAMSLIFLGSALLIYARRTYKKH